MSSVDGAPPWVSGLLAGVQGALLSLLVVVVPTLAAYVATSADPANAEVGWPRAAGVGAVLWLLGHGGSVRTAGATVSLVPLGLTAVVFFAAYASARRSAHATRAAWGAATLGHLAVVVVVLLIAGPAGPLGAGPWSVLRLVAGTVLVAGAALGAGTVGWRRVREVSRPVWSWLPPGVRRGLTAGVLAVALLVGVAAVVAGSWVVAGRAAAGDVVAGLGVDVFGGVLLAVAQTAVAPNLVLWVLAWVAGPGFAVGAGTSFAPAEVVSGPLPALPLFGALPVDGGGGGPARWVPLVVVVAGAVAGWWLHRAGSGTRAWDAPVTVACAGVGAGALAAALSAVAGGAVGPGRLTVVGAAPLLVGVVVGGQVLLGAALVAVPGDPAVRRAVAVRGRAAWARVREGRSARPSADATPTGTGDDAAGAPTGAADDPTGTGLTGGTTGPVPNRPPEPGPGPEALTGGPEDPPDGSEDARGGPGDPTGAVGEPDVSPADGAGTGRAAPRASR